MLRTPPLAATEQEVHQDRDDAAEQLGEMGRLVLSMRQRTGRINSVTYQRVLGDELRKLRNQQDWTRKPLQGSLQTEVSLQTLATYELGSRQWSVVRLAEICQALGVMPHDLLARVHNRIFTDFSREHIRLELSRLAGDSQPELLPRRPVVQQSPDLGCGCTGNGRRDRCGSDHGEADGSRTVWV